MVTGRYCYRCKEQLTEKRPISKYVDYVIAKDITATNEENVLIALMHNQGTLKKLEAKEPIMDDEYTRTPFIDTLENVAKVVTELQKEIVQGTGLVCPKCYRDTDTVIWGVHKT